MLEVISSSKWLILALLPFSVIILFGGWLVMYTRGGRPLVLKIHGFGVRIEIDNRVNKETDNHDCKNKVC